MKLLRRHWILSLIASFALVATAWAAVVPVAVPSDPGSRIQVFEIPKGTWARRMSGDRVEILPSEIRLTLGVRDILLLKNLDDVPQIFGPTLIMPGQSFQLPFEVASSYVFACTAHVSGQMTIVVEPGPNENPWTRVRWRLSTLWEPERWR